MAVGRVPSRSRRNATSLSSALGTVATSGAGHSSSIGTCPSVCLAISRGRTPIPSIWPFNERRNSSCAATKKSRNLMLELPALTTRIASVTGSGLDWLFRNLALTEKRCHGAGSHAGHDIVGARGEYDRHPRAEHDAGRIGV